MLEYFAVIKNITGFGKDCYVGISENNSVSVGDIVMFHDKAEKTEIFGRATACISELPESEESRFLSHLLGDNLVDIEEVYEK